MSQENYNNFSSDLMVNRRQRPMMLSAFQKLKHQLDIKTYPLDTYKYTDFFLEKIDNWIKNHTLCQYQGLETFTRKDAIIGTTQSLDEMHHLYGNKLTVYKNEYKYHRRLTDSNIKQVEDYKQITAGDVFLLSYPSCITTGNIDEYEEMLDWCFKIGVPVHIDGAWFGCVRNFSVNVDHPAIKTVSTSLSKSLGLGAQRIGIRYSKERINGPITIMNEFRYCNVSDMWLGVNFMDHFGTDYYWKNYTTEYEKVCNDFNLNSSQAIHIAFDKATNERVGVRTPLRYLIDGYWDQHGLASSLTEVEKNEK
jgi:hypothetical protein|tara:strand:- start:97 stop:1020 length:924 start_codon:yes stop_codon:yes gene_type:complete